jgi:hypothetical protein
MKNIDEQKNCLFQYATDFGGYAGIKIYEDTDLITRNEAIQLWNKNLLKANKEIEDGARVDMVIWVGCKNNTDYHTRDEQYNYDQKELTDE